MAHETLGGWLGMAPGLAIALSAWWRGQRLLSRMSAVAFAEHNWTETQLDNQQTVALWRSPEQFITPADSPAMVEAKQAILRYRFKALRGVCGGGILAAVGGVAGSLLARAVA